MSTASILPFVPRKPRKTTPMPQLPRLDLDGLFAAQQTNLAAVRDAQSVLAGTAQAIVEVQFAYLERSLLDARAAAMGTTTPETALANVRIATERSVELAKKVLALVTDAQRRITEHVTQRMQVSIDKLAEAAR